MITKTANGIRHAVLFAVAIASMSATVWAYMHTYHPAALSNASTEELFALLGLLVLPLATLWALSEDRRRRIQGR